MCIAPVDSIAWATPGQIEKLAHGFMPLTCAITLYDSQMQSRMRMCEVMPL